MKYVVIGGAGAMGKIVVRDLIETAGKQAEIVIADYNQRAAQQLVKSLRDKRLKAVGVDVRRHTEAAKKLKGASVVVNSVHYHYNLDVMEIALLVGAHYTDLGGLFHVTRKQLRYDRRFKRAGLTAVVGMGAAPGITNLLARLAADRMEVVREIHTRVGSMDQTVYKPEPALGVSYSLKTIMEEFSFRPAVFTKGRFTFAEPMSGAVPHPFPKPVGVQRPMYTIHSEVATLPLSYKKKGVREVSFKIAFDPQFVDRVRFLRDLGLASEKPIDIQGQRVSPLDLVDRVVMSQPKPKQVGKLKQYEVVRAIVKGVDRGKKITKIVDLHTAGMPSWGVGLDIDTGSPPAVVAQMLARGLIKERGVLPPEKGVPVVPFFRELKRRGMTVKEATKKGWNFPT